MMDEDLDEDADEVPVSKEGMFSPQHSARKSTKKCKKFVKSLLAKKNLKKVYNLTVVMATG